MHHLRAACFEGRACSSSTIVTAQSLISSNLLFRYLHPEIGIVAFGDAGRFRNIDGAVGFVAPWIETHVVDASDAPLPAETEGILRFRPFHDAFGLPAQKSSETPWIYPQQRAKIMKNKLLIIRGPV